MEISLSNVMELSKFYNNQIFKAFTFFFKVKSHFILQRNSKIILYFNSKLNHSRKIVNIYIYFFFISIFRVNFKFDMENVSSIGHFHGARLIYLKET